MFGVLLRARYRMLVNIVRTAPVWQKTVISILVTFALLLFAGIGFACYLLVALAQGDPAGLITGNLSPSAIALIGKIYEYLFFFLLAGSVPFVAATLFQADDLPLLLTTPVSPSAVVAAKLVDATVVNAAQFFVLGVPILIGLGWAVHLSFVGWLWLIIAIVLLLVLPPVATAGILLIAAQILGMRRVRFVVMLVSIGLGLSITLLAVVGTSRATSSGTITQAQVQKVLKGQQAVHTNRPDAVEITDSTPKWIPSSWAADMLQDTAGGRSLKLHGLIGLTKLALVTFLFVPLCLIVGQRVFSSEAFLETQDSGGVRRSNRLRGSFVMSSFRPGIAGLMVKDLKYIARDLILLGQIGTALILFIVPFVLRLGQGTTNQAGNDMYGYLTLGMLVLIVYMVTSIISLTSVGLEGRGGWIILAAPISRGDFLRAKWLLSFILSTVIVAALTMVGWAIFAWSGWITLIALGIFVSASFALSGLGVGLSGLFPRFIYENPAHRASVWALILGFVFATGYIVLCCLIAGLAYTAVQREISGVMAAEIVSTILFLAVSILTGFVPFVLAERRLQNYAWEL